MKTLLLRETRSAINTIKTIIRSLARSPLHVERAIYPNTFFKYSLNDYLYLYLSTKSFTPLFFMNHISSKNSIQVGYMIIHQLKNMLLF